MTIFSGGGPIITLILGLLWILALVIALRTLKLNANFLAGTFLGFIGGPMLFASYILINWLPVLLNPGM